MRMMHLKLISLDEIEGAGVMKETKFRLEDRTYKEVENIKAGTYLDC